MKNLNEHTRTVLQASQSIASFEAICRELAENSLDAKATNIDIIVHFDGSGKICIQDNGTGFPQGQLEALNQRYRSSKTYRENSRDLESFGFRGVALSSVINLAGSVKIESVHGSCEYKFGQLFRTDDSLSYGGTRISIDDPFSTVPVRKNLALENSAKVANDCRLEMERLYIFASSTCQFRLFFYFDRKERTVIYPPLPDALSRLSHLFPGTSFKSSVHDFCFTKDDQSSVRGTFSVIQGTCKRRFLALNGRPVDWRKLSLLLTKVDAVTFDFVALVNVQSNDLEYDLNVEPDKRTPLLGNEKELLVAVESVLLPSSNNHVQSDHRSENFTTNSITSTLPVLSSPRSPPLPKPIRSSLLSPHVVGASQSRHLPIKRRVPDNLGCCLDEVDDSEELTKGCRASELKSQEGQPLNQIDASDFTNSRVIGSFNKSFVLVRLQNGRLLAVDQHAADERVQLETLISSFKCDSHTLLEPIQLSVEPLAVEWLLPAVQKEVRRVFGFDFDVDPQGCLLIIKRLPLLGGVILKPTDLLEILERSQLTGQVVLENSPAVMSHLAMRACKSAVKLGDDVDFNRMSSLVQRLMQCRNPWVSHSLSDSTRRVHTAVLLFVSSIGIQPRPDRLLGLWR